MRAQVLVGIDQCPILAQTANRQKDDILRRKEKSVENDERNENGVAAQWNNQQHFKTLNISTQHDPVHTGKTPCSVQMSNNS
jgi:hypothetical protein